MTDFGNLDPLVLDRVLAGDASAAELAMVQRWAAEQPGNAQLLAALEAYRAAAASGASLTEDDVRTNASWQQVRERMRGDEGKPSAGLRLVPAGMPAAVSRRPRWVATATRIAAALIVAVGGVFTWKATRTVTHEMVAPLGRRERLTLADGSQVVLAPGSRLTWRGTFGETTRELTLEGEAYFDVVHDESRPFRVRARDGVAEDVGTRFVVRAWPELAALDVAVEEGAVALADTIAARGPAAVTLNAGQLGRLTASGVVDVMRNTDAALAWTRGELVFDDVPLTEALPSISRWYDAAIRSDPALGTRRLTARFTEQPLDDVLDALALALNARVLRDGRNVTLAPSNP